MSAKRSDEEERFHSALESYLSDEPIRPDFRDLPVKPHLILCAALVGYLVLNILAFFYFRHQGFVFGRLPRDYVSVCFVQLPILGVALMIVLVANRVWGLVGVFGFLLGAVAISVLHLLALKAIGLEMPVKRSDRHLDLSGAIAVAETRRPLAQLNFFSR